MSTLREIESAADALPRSQQKLLLRHLVANLREPHASKKSTLLANEIVPWPDYHARLYTIYGDKTMPSIVLAERETAPW